MKKKRRLTKGNKWFRSELNLLWDALYKWTPVQPLPGWAESENGLLPPKDESKTPAFSPMVDGTSAKTLYIYPGYFHAPKSTASENELPNYYLYPYMPRVAGVDLDASSPSGLSLTDSATNYIYMEVTLVERLTLLGGTTINPGSGDITGVGGTTDNADEVVTGLASLDYHIDEDEWPSFLVSTVEFPKTGEGISELTINIPWGKYVMGASGAVTSQEWYWTGDRDFQPKKHIMGSNTIDGDGRNPS